MNKYIFLLCVLIFSSLFESHSQKLIPIKDEFDVLSNIGISLNDDNSYYVSLVMILGNDGNKSNLIIAHELVSIKDNYHVTLRFPKEYVFLAWYSRTEILFYLPDEKKYSIYNILSCIYSTCKFNYHLQGITSYLSFSGGNGIFISRKTNAVFQAISNPDSISLQNINSTNDLNFIFSVNTLNDSLKETEIISFDVNIDKMIAGVLLKNKKNYNEYFIVYDYKNKLLIYKSNIGNLNNTKSSAFVKYNESGDSWLYSSFNQNTYTINLYYNETKKSKQVLFLNKNVRLGTALYNNDLKELIVSFSSHNYLKEISFKNKHSENEYFLLNMFGGFKMFHDKTD
jgi:hypothetical protein